MDEIVEQAVALSAFKLRTQSIELKCELNGLEEELIHCRSHEIEQAIVTLIVNATEALENAESKWIGIEFRQDEKNFTFAITNPGVKIPDDVVERMFEPYFTTKEFGKGMGLGLSVALGLVRGLPVICFTAQNVT